MLFFGLPILADLPIKHKNIICQPLIEKIKIEKYLGDVELIVVGGESDKNARPLNYDWVLSIREQCIKKGVHFEFRQCGTHCIKDGKEYTLNVRVLRSQAKKLTLIGFHRNIKGGDCPKNHEKTIFGTVLCLYSYFSTSTYSEGEFLYASKAE